MSIKCAYVLDMASETINFLENRILSPVPKIPEMTIGRTVMG